MMNRRVLVGTVLALSVVVGGCGGVGNQTTGAVNADVQPVTMDDVFSAPVPELCRHEAGNLVQGFLPLQDPRFGAVELGYFRDPEYGVLTEPKVVFGDLTGDGVDDAAVVIHCNAGGVAWPDTVHVYTDGPTWLGMVNMGELNGETGRVHVDTMEIVDGQVDLTWMGFASSDSSCCPSLPRKGSVRWNGETVVIADVTDN